MGNQAGAIPADTSDGCRKVWSDFTTQMAQERPEEYCGRALAALKDPNSPCKPEEWSNIAPRFFDTCPDIKAHYAKKNATKNNNPCEKTLDKLAQHSGPGYCRRALEALVDPPKGCKRNDLAAGFSQTCPKVTAYQEQLAAVRDVGQRWETIRAQENKGRTRTEEREAQLRELEEKIGIQKDKLQAYEFEIQSREQDISDRQEEIARQEARLDELRREQETSNKRVREEDLNEMDNLLDISINQLKKMDNLLDTSINQLNKIKVKIHKIRKNETDPIPGSRAPWIP